MIIEKDGIKYQVVKIIDEKKELQEELKNLELALTEHYQIDTTGLEGSVKRVVEKENEETTKLDDSLKIEIETIKLKLKNYE
jgi:hypothetical protein